MIVVHKKRLMLILGSLCIAVLAFSFSIAKEKETIETVSLPVSNKVIVLDARTSESQMKEQKAVMVQQRQKLT